jgi:hypothetical protein
MSLGKRGGPTKPGASTADVNKAIATQQRLRHHRVSLLNHTVQKARRKEADYTGIFLDTFDPGSPTEDEPEVLLEKSSRVLKRASLVLPRTGFRRRSKKAIGEAPGGAENMSAELEHREENLSQGYDAEASDVSDVDEVDVTRRYSETRPIMPIDRNSLRREPGSKGDSISSCSRQSVLPPKGRKSISAPSPREARAEKADVFDLARAIGGANPKLCSQRRSFMRKQTIQGGAAVIKSWKLPESLRLTNCKVTPARPSSGVKAAERDRAESRVSTDSANFTAAVPVAPPEDRTVYRPKAFAARRLTEVQTMPEQLSQDVSAGRMLKERATVGETSLPKDTEWATTETPPSQGDAKVKPGFPRLSAGARWTHALTAVVAEAAQAKMSEPKSDWAEVIAGIAQADAEKQLEGQPLKPLKSFQRDSCIMMRATLLGKVGDENDRKVSRDTTAFDNPRGSAEDLWAVWRIWAEMDQNCVGRVEAYDFIRWFSERGRIALAAKLWKAVSGKEDQITLNHMLRVLWPRAQSADFDAMKLTMEERKRRELSVVPAPDIMTHEQRFDLIKVFEFLDADGSGEISVKELIDAGFMSREEAVSNVDTFSKGSGELDVEMFLEMMCPHGYRYSKESTSAYDDSGDGSTIKKDPTDRKWYRETLPPNCDQFLRSLYPERYS